MSGPENTRREFLKSTSTVMAGAALAPLASAGAAEPDKPAILNFNPKMGYRRLGKTGLMVSEISLGGHGWRNAEDRKPVLQKAVELGMNYVDNNMVTECNCYGQAMDGSAPGLRRKDWIIGFASWPTKLTTEYEKELSPERFLKEIDERLKTYKTDMLDVWRPVGATWGEGQTKISSMLGISDRVLDMVAGVFEKVHQQGKVRFLGVSAHNPKVFHNILTNYPQFSVIIFPYLFLTKEFGGDSLPEAGPGEGRRRDWTEAVRGRHHVRSPAATDQGQDRHPGPRAGQGDAPGEAAVGRHPGREHRRPVGGERAGLVRPRQAEDTRG